MYGRVSTVRRAMSRFNSAGGSASTPSPPSNSCDRSTQARVVSLSLYIQGIVHTVRARSDTHIHTCRLAATKAPVQFLRSLIQLLQILPSEQTGPASSIDCVEVTTMITMIITIASHLASQSLTQPTQSRHRKIERC